MKLGYIGLPWALISLLAASINALIGYGFNQLALYFSVTTTIWILPILANIASWIFFISGTVSILLALVSTIMFVFTLISRKG